ncbi:MAG: transcription repressor NadR [Bacillaceae bacterium]|nr:transcription repressor NadR [Bacillaceae bacterium]
MYRRETILNQKKMLGEERRNLMIEWLERSAKPITGSDLARKTNVSRQVIVQDISILKARNHPIIATSQGYIYMKDKKNLEVHARVIACQHQPNQTEHELNIIVDLGGTVKDVVVEHPVYGEITASLLIRNRRDVKHFIEKFNSTNAALLSELTEGVHLHTIEAEFSDQLDEICEALDSAGYLLTNNL